MEVATLVIAGLNLICTAMAPIIVGGAYLLKHVKKSDCCGGSIEVEHSPREETKKRKSKPIDIGGESMYLREGFG